MSRIFNVSAGFLALAFLTTVASSAGAQPGVESNVDLLIRTEMRDHKIPGLQIAILRHGEIVFDRAYGLANVSAHIPMTTQSLMPINSISKAITGVAIMSLVESGKLRLEAPVGTYLPDLPASWKQITLQQLLSHTSGLPEIVNDNVELRGAKDDDTAWKLVQSLPIHFVPGAQFEYCQTNYAILQRLIEKVSGMTFAQFIKDEEATVAGMQNTSVQGGDHLPPNMVPTYTYLRLIMRGFETVGVQKLSHLTMRHEPMPYSIEAAGGVVSTAEDLAHWLVALQSRQILKDPESLTTLWTPQRLISGKYGGLDDVANGYALGWPIIMRHDHPAYAPEGGERAAIFVYPHDELTVIILTNLMGGSPQGFIDNIASLYFGSTALRHD